MTVFSRYAQFYDLLYRDKKYEDESDFIRLLLTMDSVNPVNSILDLGCGTGGHVLALTRHGYRVTGVDRSVEMLTTAREKAKSAQIDTEWLEGDVRQMRVGSMFDAAISMFAVMGYQISNQDVSDVFQTARLHLRIGGLFIFDAWFGPAVLIQGTETRVKEIQVDREHIMRIAVPELNTLNNTVTVHYTILNLSDEQPAAPTRESHVMRFFFVPEVEYLAQNAGFKVVRVCPFMDASRQPHERDWNVTWVLKAV